MLDIKGLHQHPLVLPDVALLGEHVSNTVFKQRFEKRLPTFCLQESGRECPAAVEAPAKFQWRLKHDTFLIFSVILSRKRSIGPSFHILSTQNSQFLVCEGQPNCKDIVTECNKLTLFEASRMWHMLMKVSHKSLLFTVTPHGTNPSSILYPSLRWATPFIAPAGQRAQHAMAKRQLLQQPAACWRVSMEPSWRVWLAAFLKPFNATRRIQSLVTTLRTRGKHFFWCLASKSSIV
jgi:hypothetical protein